MSRRSKKLDDHLGKLVDITFSDGDKQTGVLEYGMHPEGYPPDDKYTLYVFGRGYLILRKTHVKSIKEHN